MHGRNFGSHWKNLKQYKTYLPKSSTFFCPNFSSPFLNKMALSTNCVHWAAFSEVFNATCMKKKVWLTFLRITSSPSPERFLLPNERTWFAKEKETVQIKSRCPVEFYKAFQSHRSKGMLDPDAPFYPAINHRWKPNDKLWYIIIWIDPLERMKLASSSKKPLQ